MSTDMANAPLHCACDFVINVSAPTSVPCPAVPLPTTRRCASGIPSSANWNRHAPRETHEPALRRRPLRPRPPRHASWTPIARHRSRIPHRCWFQTTASASWQSAWCLSTQIPLNRAIYRIVATMRASRKPHLWRSRLRVDALSDSAGRCAPDRLRQPALLSQKSHAISAKIWPHRVVHDRALAGTPALRHTRAWPPTGIEPAPSTTSSPIDTE